MILKEATEDRESNFTGKKMESRRNWRDKEKHMLLIHRKGKKREKEMNRQKKIKKYIYKNKRKNGGRKMPKRRYFTLKIQLD